METEGTSPLPAILLVVALLSVGGAFCVGLRWLEPSRATTAQVQPVDRAPATPKFQLGEIVKVKDPNALVIAVSPEAGAAAERYLRANDERGMMKLQYYKLVSYQPGGGRVRITGFDADPEATQRLGCEITWVEARRIDGEYEGAGGWIDAACLAR